MSDVSTISNFATIQLENKIFKSFFFKSSSVMFILDPRTGKFIVVNEQALKFYKYNETEFKKITIKDINMLPPEQIKIESEKALLEKRNHFVFPHKLKTGEIKDVEVFSTPIDLEGESFLFSIVHDITERKLFENSLIQAKNEIFEHKQFLQNLIDNIPALIAYWDCNFINVIANRTYYDFYNLPPDQIKGKHIKDVIGKAYEKNLPYLMGVLKGDPQVFERTIETPQGTKYTKANYIPDIKDGKVLGFYALVIDITELKKLQENEQSTQAQMYYNSKLSTLGEMAGSIAHEINNPLTVIAGRAKIISETLSRSTIDQKVHESIDKNIVGIEKTVLKIATIVKGLRAFSRDSNEDSFEMVSFKDLLSDAVSLISENLKSKEIHFEITGNDFDESLSCNRIQIEQVILNLVSNSIHAISKLESKWIRISLETLPENFILRVVDSGAGVPSAVEEKMMNPFFTTKDVGEGTGLGLSISKGIIEKHQGDLKYELFQGNTSFKMTFPRIHL